MEWLLLVGVVSGGGGGGVGGGVVWRHRWLGNGDGRSSNQGVLLE